MKYIYGPVASWRLGSSLGLDVICSPKKICSFNCIYCQLEKTERITDKRQEFVKTELIVEEAKKALKESKPDVLTFSGSGEPTLATNIGKIYEEIKKTTSLPFAILTNSTLFYDKEVQNDLKKLDIIVAKLDASNQKTFEKINRPAPSINFEKTLAGIKEMKKKFSGKFCIQTMFIEENKDEAEEIANICREINPDEIQINTPLRPCKVKPLAVEELDRIEEKFEGLPTISVYHSKKPVTDPLDKIQILKRRGVEK